MKLATNESVINDISEQITRCGDKFVLLCRETSLLCTKFVNNNSIAWDLHGVFTLPDTDTDFDTDTDAIGFQTHCVGVGASVGKGKICVGVRQCEHTFKHELTLLRFNRVFRREPYSVRSGNFVQNRVIK